MQFYNLNGVEIKGMPKSIGILLEKFSSLNNFKIGIHRTPKDELEVISSFFEKGILNKKLEYNFTVATYLCFKRLLDEILSCSWKNSKICLIVLIPKNPDTNFYYIENYKNYIMPKFILGYLKIENMHVTKFIKNPSFLKDIDYEIEKKDEYIYERSIIDKKIKLKKITLK